VRGAVITVRDHVNVKATTATGRAPPAYLYDGVKRPTKGAGGGGDEFARGVAVKPRGGV
jgi:hypothetical protein